MVQLEYCAEEKQNAWALFYFTLFYFLSIVMRRLAVGLWGCEIYKYTCICRVSCGVCVSERVRACVHTYVICRKIINDSKVFYTLHDARTCDCSHGICHS